MSSGQANCGDRSLQAEVRSRPQASEKRGSQNVERRFSKQGTHSVFKRHRNVSKGNRKARCGEVQARGGI